MTSRKHYLGPELPDALSALEELALDLRWSWSHSTDALWEAIDKDTWHATGNPWLMLQTVSSERLAELAGNQTFLADLRQYSGARREALAAPSWCESCVNLSELGTVAYFSMEFGLSEALPLYSGGLGILAGDYLKTASDLGVPVAGVGLLFQRGYFRQSLDSRGRQIALFPYNDPLTLPVMPLRDNDDEWIRITLALPGREISLRCWEVVVGRNRLYLLDSNDPVNLPQDRGITGELYGGNTETRLQQELMLGVGGWKLLETIGADIKVCHLNEGHAAFATLARCASLMNRASISYDAARVAVRSGTLFTTHTPVAAAFDRFPIPLIRQYLTPLAANWKIPIDAVMALGAEPQGAANGDFNMTNLAVRTAGAINGVAKSHEDVSRVLFTPLFPRWPIEELPVGHVTNGVHMPSWDSPAADKLWTQACGKERWRGGHEELEQLLRAVPDELLWECRCENRRHLIDDLRHWRHRQQARHGAMSKDGDDIHAQFDPNALIVGFARRFTGYKRTNLLLHFPQRLIRLLTNPSRPVQLVFAGKADPRDTEGLAMIEEWTRFLRDPALGNGHVVFVEDYDMAVAASLTAGVDVWINTPRRPWEACGTSGMKVLVNGGLNLSVLDGWWAEAYQPALGWAVGGNSAPEHGTEWDLRDAESLYSLLENEVIPQFFERDETGIPRRWVAHMRESMAQLTPAFSSNRMLREYLESYYLPLARQYADRTGNGAALARELAAWTQRVETGFPGTRVVGPNYIATDHGWRASALVYIDGLHREDLRVELYANPLHPGGIPERIEMDMTESLTGAVQGFHYETLFTTGRPLSDYTLRLLPVHAAAAVPLECPTIKWIENRA